jgi:lipoyl(octanoyl) transferase
VPRRLAWSYLGAVPYAATAALQEELRQGLREAPGSDDWLLLLEHDPPVFTVGRNASRRDVVASDAWLTEHGVEVEPTNRGGKVTYHGPGQLVGYPIIDLNPDRRDIRRYVRDLQDGLIQSLAELGIEAWVKPGQENVGVWVGDAKIASIGVHLSRWITLHGFALNVATRLSHFSGIVACGLPQVKMTSVQELLGGATPSLEQLAGRVAEHLAQRFDRHLVRADGEALRRRIFERGTSP